MRKPILSCPDPSVWQQKVSATVEDVDGCWVWQNKLDRYGYGRFSFQENGVQRNMGAHRAAWLAFRGDIPEADLMTDHLCRNRACVNPWHLELVTNQVNVQRGWDVRPAEKRKRIQVKSRPKPGCAKHGRVDGRVVVEARGQEHFKCYICGRERGAAARAARTTVKDRTA